jgi:hypothetical protein
MTMSVNTTASQRAVHMDVPAVHGGELVPSTPPTVYERMFAPEKVVHYNTMQQTQNIGTEMAFIGRTAAAVVLDSVAVRLESVHRLGALGAQYSDDPACQAYYPLVAAQAIETLDNVYARLHTSGFSMMISAFERRR